MATITHDFTAPDEPQMVETEREECPWCEGTGWVNDDDDPAPTPQGPFSPSYRCLHCDGRGYVEVRCFPAGPEETP